MSRSSMLIQSSVKKINLQPSWPSYQSHKQVSLLVGRDCTLFQEKTGITYLATLDATIISRGVQQGMYTVWGKASCKLQILLYTALSLLLCTEPMQHETHYIASLFLLHSATMYIIYWHNQFD